MMSADSLLSMPRAELVARASGLGVEHADRMTRPELRDEILRRTKSGAEAAEARGLFGIARSMLASMMETGLKMPDAAALIRGTQTLSAQVTTGAPVATVTLAEIYAAQGHPDRALAIADRVLELEPDHKAARSLKDRLVAEGESLATGLAVREAQAPPVLETTGEEIQTGEPPKVESRPQPTSSHSPEDRAETALEAAGPDPVVPERLELEVRGPQLIVRWTLGRGGLLPEGVTPMIVVVGFQGHERSSKLESRVPLSLPGSGESGSVRLDGFFGASVCAALGFYREGELVPLTQALLGRTMWHGGSARPSEGATATSD